MTVKEADEHDNTNNQPRTQTLGPLTTPASESKASPKALLFTTLILKSRGGIVDGCDFRDDGAEVHGSGHCHSRPPGGRDRRNPATTALRTPADRACGRPCQRLMGYSSRR